LSTTVLKITNFSS